MYDNVMKQLLSCLKHRGMQICQPSLVLDPQTKGNLHITRGATPHSNHPPRKDQQHGTTENMRRQYICCRNEQFKTKLISNAAQFSLTESKTIDNCLTLTHFNIHKLFTKCSKTTNILEDIRICSPTTFVQTSHTHLVCFLGVNWRFKDSNHFLPKFVFSVESASQEFIVTNKVKQSKMLLSGLDFQQT